MALIFKARDGDGDGKVYDGTPRERPVGPGDTIGRGRGKKLKRALGGSTSNQKGTSRSSGGGRGRASSKKPLPKTKQKYPGMGTKEYPFRGVKDADEALDLIARGQHVEMDPDTVGVVLGKLAEIGQKAFEAEKRGEAMDVPDYDLCRIHVPKSNIFCVKNQGIPRIKMPQVKGKNIRKGSKAEKLLAKQNAERAKKGKDPDLEVDATAEFVSFLKGKGITIDAPGDVPADRLKATQNQLVGSKVGGMIGARKSGKFDPGKDPIFVSSDNYVLDGHHRWAAVVGSQYSEGKPLNMNAQRINLPIQELITLTNDFLDEFGILPNAATGTGKVEKGWMDLARKELPCIGCGDEVSKKRGKAGHGPNPKSTPKEIVGSHGHKPHGKSILWPALYEHLRKKGYSKRKAAMISNGQWRKKRGLPPASARGAAGRVTKTDLELIAKRKTLGLAPRKFNPRQPRGPDGRWVTAGGSKLDMDAYNAVVAASKKRHKKKKGKDDPTRQAIRGALKTLAFHESPLAMATSHHAPLPMTLAAAKGRVVKAAESIPEEMHGEISKIDEDQQLVYGWMYVTHDKYGNEVIDKSGDFIDDIAELETAAVDFVLHSRQGGVDHKRDGDSPLVKSRLVESMVFTPEKVAALGLEPGSLPTGWWAGWKVDDDLWPDVKSGKYKSFSIHGSGVREAVIEKKASPQTNRRLAAAYTGQQVRGARSSGNLTAKERKQRIDAARASANARRGTGTKDKNPKTPETKARERIRQRKHTPGTPEYNEAFVEMKRAIDTGNFVGVDEVEFADAIKKAEERNLKVDVDEENGLATITLRNGKVLPIKRNKTRKSNKKDEKEEAA